MMAMGCINIRMEPNCLFDYRNFHGDGDDSGIPANALLAEDGTPLRNEDGSYLLAEDE